MFKNKKYSIGLVSAVLGFFLVAGVNTAEAAEANVATTAVPVTTVAPKPVVTTVPATTVAPNPVVTTEPTTTVVPKPEVATEEPMLDSTTVVGPKPAVTTASNPIYTPIDINELSEEKGQNQVLLVLDNSGSMQTKELTAAKTAAKKVVDILLANNKSTIGIITFATVADVKTKFTNNKESLYATIDAIQAYGSTNYYDALYNANNIFVNADSDDHSNRNKKKIIVFFSDGIPNVGARKEEAGPFTSADNVEYTYANGAVNYKNSFNGKYDIYTVGLFHNLTDKERPYATRLIKELSTKKYYTPETIDDMIKDFETIAEDIDNETPTETPTTEVPVKVPTEEVIGEWVDANFVFTPKYKVVYNLTVNFYTQVRTYYTYTRYPMLYCIPSTYVRTTQIVRTTTVFTTRMINCYGVSRYIYC